MGINSARVAKKKLDNHSFFGKPLHVCYAPEYETVQDTREKLHQRRKIIAQKTRGRVACKPACSVCCPMNTDLGKALDLTKLNAVRLPCS